MPSSALAPISPSGPWGNTCLLVSDSGSVSDSALFAPCFCELEGLFVYVGARQQDQRIDCLGRSLLYAIADASRGVSDGHLTIGCVLAFRLAVVGVGSSLPCCGTHP